MNIGEAIRLGRKSLLQSSSPAIDCQFLLCHLLQCNEAYLHSWPDKKLTDEQHQTYCDYLEKRVNGHPVAHILGQRGFWTLDLKVSSDTLIPRPDTEVLVSAALDRISSGMLIADLGTGSGAIALALASERVDVNIIAADYSASALLVAKQNVENYQLDHIALWQGDWLSAVMGCSLDMIVSNPPYIESNDIHIQQGDVRFEPLEALIAGHDGLDDIRVIAEQAQRCLKPNSWLLVEHGYQQAKAVRDIFLLFGLVKIETIRDYGGNDRVTVGKQPL
ncbi:MAG: release factor glutamine methyltransferase [Methylophagaceae bacterium]|jgi:release factor glutamine methyltransferase